MKPRLSLFHLVLGVLYKIKRNLKPHGLSPSPVIINVDYTSLGDSISESVQNKELLSTSLLDLAKLGVYVNIIDSNELKFRAILPSALRDDFYNAEMKLLGESRKQ